MGEEDIAGEDIWTVVATPDATYNLLELVNGVIQHLGITDLDAGDYNQMRLVLGNVPDESLNVKGENHPFANYIIYGEDSAGDIQTQKVTICHKGRQMRVNDSALDAHLKHGDTFGACTQ